MKKLFIALLLGCGSSALAGTISGGGGGISKPEPVSVDRVSSSISVLKRNLYTTLYTYENFNSTRRWPEDRNSLFDKVFDRTEKNVYEIISDLTVEIREGKACKDENDNDVDGSFYLDSNTICISAFTVSQKVNSNNYEELTLGLIAHEVAHLMGLSEEESESLQRAVVGSLSAGHMDLVRMHSNALVNDLMPNPQSIIELISQMDKVIEENGVTDLHSVIVDMLKDEMSVDYGLLNSISDIMMRIKHDVKSYLLGPNMFLSPDLYQQLDLQSYRLIQVINYICTKDINSDVHRVKRCQKNIDDGFKGEGEVSLNDYVFNLSGVRLNMVPENKSLKIKKITHGGALFDELETLKRFSLDLKASVEKIRDAKFKIIIK